MPLVEDGWIAVGWTDAGDLTPLNNDREEFKDRLRERYPARNESWVANAAGQFLRFRHVMAVDDLVVYPRKIDRSILDHYERLPDEAKQALPLRRVWMPDRPSAEE